MPSPFVARFPAALALLSALPAGHVRLRPFDLALVAIYLVGITLFGLRFRKRPGSGAEADKSLKSYFLADNTIPWWAIALSIVSAETSTLTIISIPGVAFTGDFGFLQVVIGYMLGRIVVALLFLPRYFAGEMLTAYQLIDRRFGAFLHKLTAGLFLVTRAAAEGVRVFAVSIVVAIAIGTGNVLSIAIISALTLLYTFEGGMAAVIWTDVVQMAIYLGGTVVAILTLGSHVPGGWNAIHTVGAAAGKFHMLNFALNLTTAYTFWAGVLGGTFLTMASHGTDQLMVQRMLAARNLRQSQLALLSSGMVIFVQFALFLLIGAGLFVFYGAAHARGGVHLPPGTTPDRLFPTFIVREMPLGLAGLLVAAILAAAMSNLSAALNSLSSATVVDFYMHLRPDADARERALISKSSTVLWALVLFAIAVYSIRAGGHGHVVEIGLSIASVAYGCLLGVFLLGTLTRFATETGAALGMVCGFALNLWLWQGDFPVHLGPLTIPRVAWTWYVLIGAAATFLIGSLASLLFGRQSPRRRNTKAATAATLLLFAVILSGASRTCDAQSKAARISPAAPQTPGAPFMSQPHRDMGGEAQTPDFTAVSSLINDAIAAKKLPGAVVLIGHNGHIVFEHAYGDRKLAGEPGLNGKPSPAKPMTEDTIFDMASLTKVLATAPSIMQLYEAGKIASFDDPVQKYLPAFNESHDPERARVTLRMLLTHTSGEPPDVNLKDPWGLAAPDKAEGIHRALTTSLANPPGSKFVYSDINFILLGHLVEKLFGQSEDVYARQHIFERLGMADTRYLPFARACGSFKTLGAAVLWESNYTNGRNPDGSIWTSIRDYRCSPSSWVPLTLIPRIAPTVHDNEGTAATNPDFDRLLRGTVDDPTTRRMGGVAGHAGVFSTAHDVALYAQALLDKLRDNTGPFPLKQSTLRLMTTPEQPSTVEHATILTLDPSQPTPTLMPTQGTPVRGFGWDINSAYSRPRGAVFPTVAPSQPTSATPSFGHTGYTGTSLWIDPNSDTYVILLANAIHPRGRPTISPLRGEVATAAAEALGLYASCPVHTICDPAVTSGSTNVATTPTPLLDHLSGAPFMAQSYRDMGGVQASVQAHATTLTGIDILESTHFAALTAAAAHHHHLTLGLLTNQTGLDSPGAPFMAQPYRNMGGVQASVQAHATTLTGINILESTHFAALTAAAAHHHHLTLGLLTNQTGLDSPGAPFMARPYRDMGGVQASVQAHATTLTGIDVLKSTHFAALTAAAAHHHHLTLGLLTNQTGLDSPGAPFMARPYRDMGGVQASVQAHATTLTGIDILESTHFAALTAAAAHHHHLTLGLLTNQTGLDSHDRRTIDILHSLTPDNIHLTTLFSPEHGLFGAQDTTHLRAETDAATGLPVVSLYGPTATDKRPTHAELKDLDAVVIDLQDAGVRFYTYETVVGYFLEAAAQEQTDFHHRMEVVVLDRPDPLGGEQVQGPVSDPGPDDPTRASYINYMPLPIRHGLTLGELARYIVGTKHLDTHLTVIPMQHWTRGEYFDQTGLPWHDPSPNLRSLTAATFYPGLGLLDYTNISVGRGSATPFEVFGAGTSSGQQWFHAVDVAAALNARRIPGVSFSVTTVPIADDASHYPYHGQTIQAVRLILTDRKQLNSPELGLEIIAILHRLYPGEFQFTKTAPLIANRATSDAIESGDDPREIARSWNASLTAFLEARKPFLLYP